MKRTPLRKISSKQQLKLDEWSGVCNIKRQQQIDSRGYIYCEACGLPERPFELYRVWGHHKDQNRNNNTIENCLLLHWCCHQRFHGVRYAD